MSRERTVGQPVDGGYAAAHRLPHYSTARPPLAWASNPQAAGASGGIIVSLICLTAKQGG